MPLLNLGMQSITAVSEGGGRGGGGRGGGGDIVVVLVVVVLVVVVREEEYNIGMATYDVLLLLVVK